MHAFKMTRSKTARAPEILSEGPHHFCYKIQIGSSACRGPSLKYQSKDAWSTMNILARFLSVCLGVNGLFGAYSARSAPAGVRDNAANVINVRDYQAKGDNSSDDTIPIANAFAAAATAWSSGIPAVVYFPPGIYVGCGPPINKFPISIHGEGHLKSVFRIWPTCSGDIFSWSEVWAANSFPLNGDTPAINGQRAGVSVEGFSIIGDRSTSNQQNAFVFYDRADYVYMRDVDVMYLKGRCLYSGVTKTVPMAYLRESRFESLRFFNCGDVDSPVVEFNSEGTGDASNEIDITALDIYSPYGTGLIIRNGNTRTSVREFRISKLRIEGLEGNPAHIAADLLLLGDKTKAGNVNNIDIQQAALIDPYENYAAFRTIAASKSAAPYQINFAGLIGGGRPAGKGISIDAGRDLYFKLTGLYSIQTNITIGPATLVGSNITLDGNGHENTWTYSVDKSSLQSIGVPIRRYGNPSEAK